MSTDKILNCTDKLCKAIDTEVDWFILRIQTPPKTLRDFYNAMFDSKKHEREDLAKEFYERLS